jgi:hypothetical protein
MKTMKPMNTMTIRNAIWGSIAAVLLSFGLFCQQVQAAEITGDITFTGTVALDSSSAGTATMVTAWSGLGLGNLPQVQNADGDLGTFAAPGDAVTFHAPWSFSSGAIPSFWSVDGFTFDLTSSSIISQTSGALGAVSVDAVGTISGHSFDPTPGLFHFTTQDPSAAEKFSFSAAASAVPEPATLRSLLSGSSLLGGFLFMRRRRA